MSEVKEYISEKYSLNLMCVDYICCIILLGLICIGPLVDPKELPSRLVRCSRIGKSFKVVVGALLSHSNMRRNGKVMEKLQN